MSAVDIAPGTGVHHVAVAVQQEGQLRGYRVLDLRKDYPPLVKQLGLRAVAADAGVAGEPWQLHVHVTDETAPAGADIALEAHVARRRPAAEPLAVVAVPVTSFGWIASGVAKQVGLKGTYTYVVKPLAADNPIIAQWQACLPVSEDFDVIEEPEPGLRLPVGVGTTVEPPAGRQTLDAVPTWLRCVYRRSALGALLKAASVEREIERSWVGLGTFTLTKEHCYVLIEEFHPLPAAEAGEDYIVTHGRDFLALQRQMGDGIVAYAHLHPRVVEDQQMNPFPSGQDSTLAWNYDQGTASPTVFPIALFGIDPDAPGDELLTHGYEKGLLARIQMELLP